MRSVFESRGDISLKRGEVVGENREISRNIVEIDSLMEGFAGRDVESFIVGHFSFENRRRAEPLTFRDD